MMVWTKLPKEPTAPGQARRLLTCVADRLPAERLDDARLMVSEVVANAVEHVDADGQIVLRLQADDDRVRVEVDDPGTGFSPPPRDPDGERGWGLMFVDQLADRWGVGDNGRSRVWFELAT